MPSKFTPATIVISLLILGTASAAPQDRRPGLTGARMPIFYEAYYPDQREWGPRVSLEEIQKLRDLTNKLLKQEEKLGELAAASAVATPENVYEPRGQILEYVFSGPARPLRPLPPLPPLPPPVPVVAPVGNDDVQVASLTVTDAGRHKIRHHHGEAEWMLKRVVPAPTR